MKVANEIIVFNHQKRTNDYYSFFKKTLTGKQMQQRNHNAKWTYSTGLKKI
jgi:hypothetical protein